jgi:hypothetical protein
VSSKKLPASRPQNFARSSQGNNEDDQASPARRLAKQYPVGLWQNPVSHPRLSAPKSCIEPANAKKLTQRLLEKRGNPVYNGPGLKK